MTYEINISVVFQIVTLLVLIFGIGRGIVTKSDCKEYRTDIENDLEKGNIKFDEITKTQSSHGTQLETIDKNVTMLVKHHIKD